MLRHWDKTQSELIQGDPTATMWNTDEDGMGEFSHRKSQSERRHNQNRKGGVEAQGQLGVGETTDLVAETLWFRWAYIPPGFPETCSPCRITNHTFCSQKEQSLGKNLCDHVDYEQQESRDKGNCHQDVAPGSVRKTVLFTMQGEIRSWVCCLHEDLLQGEEHLACGSALYHMKEGLVDLKETECSQTYTYFSEYPSDGQLLKYCYWNNIRILSGISMNFIQLCNTKSPQMQRNTIIFKKNRSTELLPI